MRQVSYYPIDGLRHTAFLVTQPKDRADAPKKGPELLRKFADHNAQLSEKSGTASLAFFYENLTLGASLKKPYFNLSSTHVRVHDLQSLQASNLLHIWPYCNTASSRLRGMDSLAPAKW